MIKIKHNSKVFMLLPKWVEAITLGSTIHVKGSSIDNDLLRHEMVHVEQIKKDGIVKFYSLYVFYFLKNLVKHRDFKLAYKLIPYEVEAYTK